MLVLGSVTIRWSLFNTRNPQRYRLKLHALKVPGRLRVKALRATVPLLQRKKMVVDFSREWHAAVSGMKLYLTLDIFYFSLAKKKPVEAVTTEDADFCWRHIYYHPI